MDKTSKKVLKYLVAHYDNVGKILNRLFAGG